MALIGGKQVAIRAAMLEQSRQYFVTTYIEHLSGVDFEKRQTVRIRNRYDASVPTVVGAVERENPVFVNDAKLLRTLTDSQIKWTLPGPMTMVDTLYDAYYRSREKLACEFATILNQKARELEATGVDVIRYEEVADWSVAALESAYQGLKADCVLNREELHKDEIARSAWRGIQKSMKPAQGALARPKRLPKSTNIFESP